MSEQSPAFSKKYESTGGARTLSPGQLGLNESGWTIDGEIHKDYYQWVNEFSATHPEYGRVWGDYESVVYADSEVAFNHFVKHHPPDEWSYLDI